MKMIKYIPAFYLLFSCVEEVPIQTELQSDISIEDILIVETTITDEMKVQEIFLSRGANFGNDSLVNFEQNAQVRVVDELGRTYAFDEQSPGSYVSNESFAAQQNMGYKLFITTSNGSEYQSQSSQISGSSVIDDVYAERIVSDNGVEGMAIYVDSSNPNGDLNDFRYTYEETYKIIAPNWTAVEFEIIRATIEQTFDPVTGELVETLYPDVRLVPREQEEQVCYNTVESNSIILSDGNSLQGNGRSGNLVRFINSNNPILSHRYSILVRQLLQSTEAAKFYRTLLQFSQNASLFTEIQPGLIEGNIRADNAEDVVIGFFSIASVTERRLFFNYSDFFPDEELPPYFNNLNCNNVFAPPLYNPLRDGPRDDCGPQRSLISYLQDEEVEFFLSAANPPENCQGPYFVTRRECGDCTALGSNVVPDFWIEE
jgi:hypothetical protein